MTDSFKVESERIVRQFFDYNPAGGRYLGLHEYDGQVADPGRERLAEQTTWAKAQLDRLAVFEGQSLDEQAQFDLALLKHSLKGVPFAFEELKSWQDNPLYYDNQLNLTSYLSRNYAPLGDRLESLSHHQRQLPGYLAAAQANLQSPFARPVLEVALRVYRGQIRYRQEDVAQAINTAEVSETRRQEYQGANDMAIGAIERFVAFLQAEAGRSHDDFALGRDLYGAMLKYNDMVDLPIEAITAAGERDLERNFADFEETARRLDPSTTSSEVRDRLKKAHPTAAELIPHTERLLEEIRRFVVERDLITVPSEVRPIVAPTPPQYRWSFASMATPGPFETATEAYYYITLPETDWPPTQQEEWLSAYSYTTLEDISIHEVYPGHYIHFLNVKSAPSFVTKSLRGSTAHSEGWAHYCEAMLLEEGYGQGRLDVRLAQLDAALKRDCRYLAAIKMHTGGMTLEEATALFEKYAHMAPLPARQEALRGTWQPGYLAYTLGKLMLLKLREDLQRRDGSNFNLKAFHNECVGNGVPPVPLLRRKLLGDDNGSIL